MNQNKRKNLKENEGLPSDFWFFYSQGERRALVLATNFSETRVFLKP